MKKKEFGEEMKRETLNQVLGLVHFDNSERAVLVSELLIETAQRDLELLGSADVFIKWYCGDIVTECPYTREELKKLADDIIIHFSSASEDFLGRRRYDYDVIEMTFRRQSVSSLYICDVVKLMDYFANN